MGKARVPHGRKESGSSVGTGLGSGCRLEEARDPWQLEVKRTIETHGQDFPVHSVRVFIILS